MSGFTANNTEPNIHEEPCEGEPHARFCEGGLAEQIMIYVS
jgi:hypothetical protein